MPQGLGIWLNTKTGEVFVTQGVWVAAEAGIWLAAIVLGLVTAWLVMP